MTGTNEARRRQIVPFVPAGLVLGLAIVSAACGRDGPLHPRAAAQPPGGPSALLNPLCSAAGGQTHAGGTLTTAVSWLASGNPHGVTGTVTVGTGGELTIGPGVIVCFYPQTGLNSSGSGRLVAQGTAALPITFTARDPAIGWWGINLQGAPPSTSYITNARVEYTGINSTGISAFGHPLVIDSTVVRQVGAGVRLAGRTSSFIRSRVDTTTNRNAAAVTLGDSARFEQSVILRAAGIGLDINGFNRIRIGGGRIEGSGGVGIRALTEATVATTSIPLRVVGGQSYPLEATVQMLPRLYTSDWRYQDSLRGNARDTLLVTGGKLRSWMDTRLPWHVTASFTVGMGGTLVGWNGVPLVMDPGVTITADSGRVLLRGTRTNPVVLTADDPARGWGGIVLKGVPPSRSYITNARVEHVMYENVALAATGLHPVNVDSTVFRQTGRAVSILSTGSRLTRSRVDTTLSSLGPAVELGADAILESTLIRASSGAGLHITSAAVQVQSCEVRESVEDGIVMDVAVPVHNCNLVNNMGVGVRNLDAITASDATGNWWGDGGGPLAPAGDGVTGLVTYTPWLTTPFVLPYVP